MPAKSILLLLIILKHTEIREHQPPERFPPFGQFHYYEPLSKMG